MTEDLTLRQESVKHILARYQSALEANGENAALGAELVESIRETLEGQGVPLFAEEVMALIAVLESFIDFSSDLTVDDFRNGALAMLLGLVAELKANWDARDTGFFLD